VYDNLFSFTAVFQIHLIPFLLANLLLLNDNMALVSLFFGYTLFATVLAGPPTVDPPWQNDTIPPYPSLTDPSTQNTLCTRLFGWEGCSVPESQQIAEAYNDFYNLAKVDLPMYLKVSKPAVQ
jgi:hypothetical protein